MNCFRFEFWPYRRPFRHPLTTHHGEWRDREGILLRLTHSSGRVGWGEIAPLPWFGSETLEQALEVCHQLPDRVTTEMVCAIADVFPACQFGFESALAALTPVVRPSPRSLMHCALLPTGPQALQAWQPLWQAGYRCFKWKIGVASWEQEWGLFEHLIQTLPAAAVLRLDANGGLTFSQAVSWLEACDRLCSGQARVEYLEQPLPPSQFASMLELAARYATPLALDESVATLAHLQTCYNRGWRGVFVIKPAIAGSPARLRHFCRYHAIDAVFSSVFETRIGQQAGLALATELGNPGRAMGYGTSHWFTSEVEEADSPWQIPIPS